MLKVISAVFAATVVLLVVVGLFLPRQWKVEVQTQTRATKAQLLPLVRDFRQWSRWTAAMPELTYAYSEQQGAPGAWMSWQGPGSKAKFILVEANDRSVKFDEMVESDEVNAHGEIALGDGELVWRDEGTLPPVIGGYFKGMMERALAEHMRSGLAKLKVVAEGAGVEVQAADTASLVEDGGVVDAGPVSTADAGTTSANDSAWPTDAGFNAANDAGVVPVLEAELVADAGASTFAADAGVRR